MTTRHDVAVGIGAVFATIVVTLAILSSPDRGPMILIGVIAIALVAWRPVEVVIFTLVVAQEISSPSDFWATSELLVVGNWLYYTRLGAVPLALFVVVVATVVSLMRRRARPRMGIFPVVLISLLLWVLILGAAQSNEGPAGAFLASGMRMIPIIMLGFGYILGSTTETRVLRGITVAFMLGLAVNLILALIVMLTGQMAPIEYGGVHLKLFHDSATAGLFVVVALVILFSRRRWTAPQVMLALVSIALVVLCFRRSIWLAAIATVVAVVLAASGGRGVRRVILVLLPLALILFVTAPSLGAALQTQLAQIFGALAGDGARTSAGLHVTDLEVGWAAVLQSPILGVGIFDSQVAGLAAGGESLYVHNEFLQTWLRWGLLGVVQITALLAIAVVSGFNALRLADAPIVVRGAALFLLLLPVPLFTAPFITTTMRWPILVGISYGLVSAFLRSREESLLPQEGRASLKIPQLSR